MTVTARFLAICFYNGQIFWILGFRALALQLCLPISFECRLSYKRSWRSLRSITIKCLCDKAEFFVLKLFLTVKFLKFRLQNLNAMWSKMAFLKKKMARKDLLDHYWGFKSSWATEWLDLKLSLRQTDRQIVIWPLHRQWISKTTQYCYDCCSKNESFHYISTNNKKKVEWPNEKNTLSDQVRINKWLWPSTYCIIYAPTTHTTENLDIKS